ncbi:MAG: AAA family ATPase [Hyphomicrobiales bacterium]|nr:AAA family ATPase [Hyphomicrobiales bacterium]
MECPQCRATNPDSKRFCGECGSPLVATCPSCGAPAGPGKKFCGDCGAPLSPKRAAGSNAEGSSRLIETPRAAGAPLPLATGNAGAERRQLTVMFCDLVGSTELAAGMDPEDLRDVIGAYQDCVAKVVKRFQGFIAKFMGDGVLVYFGYPKASEDDAELAIRAGLKLRRKIAELNARPGLSLSVRIGIASGLVVVGDLIGSGSSQEQAIIGETPNLAARLQAIAKPSTVIIAESTHRLVGSLFDYRDLGSIALKGFAAPVAVREVIGARAHGGRFEALHAGTLTPLVGREEEIEIVLRRWSQAKEGAGRVVLLAGEAGIGKSRITETILERLLSEPHLRIRWFCSPHHTNSALFPIIGSFERAAEFEREDSPKIRREKLQAVLDEVPTSQEDAALIGELLSLPGAPVASIQAATPQKRKEMTLEALVRRMAGLAAQKPVLALFEDLHWIDATSLEFLNLLVERTRSMRLLLVLTFRPEFPSPWIGQSHVTMIALSRLDAAEAEVLAERAVGGRALPVEVRKQIVARTDGVPLFVEELTKAIIDGGWLREEGDKYVLTGPLPAAAIPTTLHASLVARFDRVAPVKEVAQIGAAVGRQFSFELMASLIELQPQALADVLEQLVSAELVHRRGTPPDAIYTFKHALVQDAAYGTLLRAKRQELHARIADVLEAKFPETAATQPEILARHCTEANLTTRALVFWQRAGERAAQRSANVEAIAHFQQGLDLIEVSPDRGAYAEQELALLIGLGPVLMATRSSAAPEVGRLYSRARLLAQGAGRSRQLYPAVWGAWLFSYVVGDIEAAGRFADDLFVIARDEGDPDLMLQAYHAAWPTVFADGDLVGTRGHVEAGLAIYVREKHASQAHLYGAHDAAVCGHLHLAWTLTLLGYPDQGLRQMDLALALGRDLVHPPSLVHALWAAAELRYMRREPRAVEECTQALEPFAAQHGSLVVVANATMLRGWALVTRGSVDEGLAALRKGLSNWRDTKSQYHVTNRLARAADALSAAGKTEEALALVDEALADVEKGATRWIESEAHRLKGELRRRYHPTDLAACERCFQQALDIARRQSAKLLELRAASSLGRLWRDQGRLDDARSILISTYEGFTEGFDTPDLKAAKALIDELGRI